MNQDWFDKLVAAGREVIRTEKAIRGNKFSYAACHPPKDTPEGKEYYRLSEEHRNADMELWMLTDCEYDDESPYKECWEWRSAKVMARKCCWYQLKHPIFGSLKAKNLMQSLHDAEGHLFAVLGLIDEYKCPCQYIEESFPNLKTKR